MYFLHVINCDRQTRSLNVLGQIAMILGDKKREENEFYLNAAVGLPSRKVFCVGAAVNPTSRCGSVGKE